MTRYQRASVHGTDDIRAITDATGSHMFDADTMRFWRSRLLKGAHKCQPSPDTVPGASWMFVTSEQVGNEPRAYTLRLVTLGESTPDGCTATRHHARPTVHFETVGDLGAFRTARAAHAHAKALQAHLLTDDA